MIKVIILLAYDFELVKNSLPCVYNYADTVLFSIDRNRVSWSGNKFNFDESIIRWINEFDVDKKIKFYEDDFYLSSNTAMQNETRQRQLSADYLGDDGWTVMFDADEYIINFREFTEMLNSYSKRFEKQKKKPIAFTANCINIFKSDAEGYYIIAGSDFPVRIATNRPKYERARNVDCFTKYTDFLLIHQSWDREEDEIYYKIKNWGHKSDFNDSEAYFDFWKNINQSNYKEVRNFYPFGVKSNFKYLKYVKAKNISQLTEIIAEGGFQVNKYFLFRKNLIQKIRKLLPLEVIYKLYYSWQINRRYSN